MEDYPIANTKFIGQFLEVGEFYSIPGNMEYDFRCSVIDGEAPE